MEREGLTPQGIATKTFKPARRGYDTDDVSEFLAEVAAAYQSALDAAAQGTSQDDVPIEPAPRSFQELGAEAGALMQTAKEGADSLLRQAEEAAAAHMKRAREQAEKIMREVTLETDRLRNATKRDCEEMLTEAQARAERLTSHERQMREKVGELEKLFLAFRDEMETSTSEPAQERSVNERDGQGSSPAA
jgi:DivIVA domain-containing protein